MDSYYTNDGMLELQLPTGEKKKGIIWEDLVVEKNPRTGSFLWKALEWLINEPVISPYQPNSTKIEAIRSNTHYIYYTQGHPDAWTESKHKAYLKENGRITVDTPFNRLPPPMRESLDSRYWVTHVPTSCNWIFESAPTRVSLKTLEAYSANDGLELLYLKTLIQDTWLVSFNLHSIRSKGDLRELFAETYKQAAEFWEKELNSGARKGRPPQEAFDYLLMVEFVRRRRTQDSGLSEMGKDSSLTDLQALQYWKHNQVRFADSLPKREFIPKDAYSNQLKPLLDRIESLFVYEFPPRRGRENVCKNSHT